MKQPALLAGGIATAITTLQRGSVYRMKDDRHGVFIGVHPHDGAALVFEETDREDGEILHFFIAERSQMAGIAREDVNFDLPQAPNLIERVFQFNRIGQTVPPNGFNADRVCFYTGMQLEELAEKIEAISGGEVDDAARHDLTLLAERLQAYGRQFKAGLHMGAVLRADREKLLDADIDVLVVSAGSLMYQTRQFRPAVEHVLDRNDAKFQIIDGKPTAVRDANGKIMKPVGWTAPDLARFIELPLY